MCLFLFLGISKLYKSWEVSDVSTKLRKLLTLYKSDEFNVGWRERGLQRVFPTRHLNSNVVNAHP